MEHHVAIIGGGLAGCATAKALKVRGVQFTLFEKQDSVGGLWVKNYPGAAVQAQKAQYEYPEVRFESAAQTYPSAEDVVGYVKDFCAEFALHPSIKLNTVVHRITRDNHGWVVHHSSSSNASSAPESITKSRFSFVVVCNGLCSNTPNIPSFPGVDKFKGKVIHSSQRTAEDDHVGRRVAVIGSGKSAIDAVMAARKPALRTTQIMRTPTWVIPRKLCGILPYKYAFHCRALSLVLPPFYNVSPAKKVLHAVGAPLKWVFWRLVEGVLLAQCRLPRHMRPKYKVEQGAFCASIAVESPGLYQAYRRGDIATYASGVKEISEEAVVLKTGEHVEADVIICATGWKTDVSLFDDAVVKELDVQNDGMYLYRHIVPARVDNLAFVGGNVLTFVNPFTHSLQAAWLARHICGDLKLPSTGNMLQSVSKQMLYKRKYFPKCAVRGALVQAHSETYHDELIRDMKRNPMQRSGVLGPLKNWLLPVEASHMEHVVRP